jgi:hypothetical protein
MGTKKRKRPAKQVNARARSAKPPPLKPAKSATPSKRERLDYIVGEMVLNRWVTGVTGVQLAKQWKLSQSTLDRDASEASRSVRPMDPAELEQRKALWMANIEAARAEANRRGRMESVKGLLELEGKALGFFEPEKIEVSGNLGDLLRLGLEEGDGGGESDSDPPDQPVEE